MSTSFGCSHVPSAIGDAIREALIWFDERSIESRCTYFSRSARVPFYAGNYNLQQPDPELIVFRRNARRRCAGMKKLEFTAKIEGREIGAVAALRPPFDVVKVF